MTIQLRMAMIISQSRPPLTPRDPRFRFRVRPHASSSIYVCLEAGARTASSALSSITGSKYLQSETQSSIYHSAVHHSGNEAQWGHRELARAVSQSKAAIGSKHESYIISERHWRFGRRPPSADTAPSRKDGCHTRVHTRTLIPA